MNNVEIREENIDLIVEMKEQEAINFLKKCGYTIHNTKDLHRLLLRIKLWFAGALVCSFAAGFCLAKAIGA